MLRSFVAPGQHSRLIRASLERFAAASARQRAAVERLLGLPESSILALQHLARAGEMTPSTLAQRMQLSSGGTTALIRRLAGAGLVTRHPHPSDKRSVILRPTTAMPPQAGDAFASFLADIDGLTDDLTSAEKVCVERYLARAADLAERHSDRLIKEAEAAALSATGRQPPVLWA
jgi:DNA-binding MarR family transcriptional regulator